MKESIKNGFGTIIGMYLGCVLISAISGISIVKVIKRDKGEAKDAE